ncbi:mitochondrial 39-S ribosomal protein L47 (MRP-L47)-domain-containing protein [Xylariaceae sp. FL1651]|nr:mitochondrial 39-S ribosomal protein L47 (MRP-L47)-domain-containing protein [Xylariaceae sp. FL1651]
MATPASIRPSISRIAHTTKSLLAVNTTLRVARPTTSQTCTFSSTPEYNNRRPRRDANRLRGLSSIYRSGTRFRMNIDKSQAPQPANYKPKVDVDPNHGLWDFFYSKDKLLLTPDEDTEHGRGWTVEELRHKSWEDLHKLWWVCIKEQNRISTARKERSRLKLPDGAPEAAERLAEVRKTMKSIKHALTERWYLWEDARKLAETDPEVDLSNTRSPFTPKDYLEEREFTPEESKEDQPTDQTPPRFMAEPNITTSEDIDPSTISPKTTTSHQPAARP